jgi:hypothetical protein
MYKLLPESAAKPDTPANDAAVAGPPSPEKLNWPLPA